ncbi:MAG: right-handed parallel beta-helix repeat-containing protein [Candidatus Hodarchaeales archaeon]
MRKSLITVFLMFLVFVSILSFILPIQTKTSTNFFSMDDSKSSNIRQNNYPSIKNAINKKNTLIEIFILGDDNFTEQATLNDWPGTGTLGDPFIIENYLNLQNIYIGDTEYHFIIRNNKITSTEGNYDQDTSGITLLDCKNVIITNNIIENQYTGLHIESLSQSQIKVSNNLFVNAEYGISISIEKFIDYGSYYESQDNSEQIDIELEISDNNLTNLGVEGINLRNIAHSEILNNFIHSENQINGIYLIDSRNTIIRDNLLHNSRLDIYGDDLESYRHTISNNTINDIPLVYVKEEYNITNLFNIGQLIIVNSNQIKLNGNENNFPILIAYSTEIFIENNYFSEMNYPISIVYSYDAKIAKNTINNSTSNGIYLFKSSKVDILENKINNHQSDGIQLLGSENIIIKYNTISHNGISGIFIEKGLGIRIEGNNITNNNDGIYCDLRSSYITIINNLLSYNGGWGVRIISCTNLTIDNNTYEFNSDGNFTTIKYSEYMFGFKSTIFTMIGIIFVVRINRKRRIMKRKSH